MTAETLCPSCSQWHPVGIAAPSKAVAWMLVTDAGIVKPADKTAFWNASLAIVVTEGEIANCDGNVVLRKVFSEIVSMLSGNAKSSGSLAPAKAAMPKCVTESDNVIPCLRSAATNIFALIVWLLIVMCPRKRLLANTPSPYEIDAGMMNPTGKVTLMNAEDWTCDSDAGSIKPAGSAALSNAKKPITWNCVGQREINWKNSFFECISHYFMINNRTWINS